MEEEKSENTVRSFVFPFARRANHVCSSNSTKVAIVKEQVVCVKVMLYILADLENKKGTVLRLKTD